MDPEKKPEADAQAPAQPKPEEKKEAPKVAGLDAIAKDPKALRELYKNSPTMFSEVIEEIEAGKKGKTEQKVEEKPKGQQPSAAPAAKTAKYGETEIKLPEDVDEKMVPVYFDHWREQGWSPEQVQKEVSFMGDLAGKAKKAAPPQETPEQRAKREDAENVATLKKDPEFGKNFDQNFEIARRAVLKYGTKEMIAKLTTSDPAIVKQFYELGKLDVEDTTPDKGIPRGGKEEKEKPVTAEDQHRKRYPNSPTMKFT